MVLGSRPRWQPQGSQRPSWPDPRTSDRDRGRARRAVLRRRAACGSQSLPSLPRRRTTPLQPAQAACRSSHTSAEDPTTSLIGVIQRSAYSSSETTMRGAFFETGADSVLNASNLNATPAVMRFRACACPLVLPGAAASRRQNVGNGAVWTARRRWHGTICRQKLKAAGGVEPPMEVLHTSAHRDGQWCSVRDCAAQSKVLASVRAGLCWRVLSREEASRRQVGSNGRLDDSLSARSLASTARCGYARQPHGRATPHRRPRPPGVAATGVSSAYPVADACGSRPRPCRGRPRRCSWRGPQAVPVVWPR